MNKSVKLMMLAAVLSVNYAFADGTSTTTASIPSAMAGDPPTGQSAAQGKTPLMKAMDNVVASYWGNFAGPRVNMIDPTFNPSSDGTNGADPNNATGGNIGMDNLLTLGYKIAPEWTVAGNFEFHWFRDISKPQYIDTAVNDPYLQIKRSKLVNSHGVTVDIDFNLFVPTSSGSQTNGLMTGLRSRQFFNWDVPGTRLSISSYSFVRYNVYSDPSATSLISGAKPWPAKANGMTILYDPYFNYQLTPTFAATLWVDGIQLLHQVGTAGFQNLDMDFEPGVNWDVSKHLSLNPYINIFPRTLTLNATYLGMVVIAKL